MILIPKTKNGVNIIGTNEVLYGTALIQGVSLEEDGSLEPCYVGETDVAWDSQHSLFTEEQRQYVDENGNIVLENELAWEDEDGNPVTYHAPLIQPPSDS